MDNNVTKEWLDLAVLVVMMGVATIILFPLMVELKTPVIADYSDKTALDATGSIMMEGEIKTGADLFLAISNTDLNIPYPRSIRINNTPIIDLNNAFIAKLSENLALIYTDSGDYKLKSMLNYKITSISFVHDDVNGDYWQYTLQP